MQIMVGRAKAFDPSSQSKASLICSLRVSGDSNLKEKVWSMQIEDQDVKVARQRQLVGLKVDRPVAKGDKVYKGK